MRECINIKKLDIGYRVRKQKIQVCSSLNASLNKGELVCLLGANGHGKSTLLKTICRFIKPLKGDISILNKSINNISEKEMSKKISIVLTEKLVVANATVEELVSYGRSPYTGFMGRLSSADREIVQTAMQQCGIAHKAQSTLSLLSDGERQKASIAKALAQDTPVILLDEPTAFLDLPSRVEIMKLLRQLVMNSGKAVVMSTHDLDLALQMADKLWLLNKNNLVTGSPEDLLYKDAFQQIFNKENISFDNRTGMFKVAYNNHKKLAVKGHGFEYVLLRRAFARKGIDVVKYHENDEYWIKIEPEGDFPFHLYHYDQCLTFYKELEPLVANTVQLVNNQKQDKKATI